MYDTTEYETSIRDIHKELIARKAAERRAREADPSYMVSKTLGDLQPVVEALVTELSAGGLDRHGLQYISAAADRLGLAITDVRTWQDKRPIFRDAIIGLYGVVIADEVLAEMSAVRREQLAEGAFVSAKVALSCVSALFARLAGSAWLAKSEDAVHIHQVLREAVACFYQTGDVQAWAARTRELAAMVRVARDDGRQDAGADEPEATRYKGRPLIERAAHAALDVVNRDQLLLVGAGGEAWEIERLVYAYDSLMYGKELDDLGER